MKLLKRMTMLGLVNSVLLTVMLLIVTTGASRDTIELFLKIASLNLIITLILGSLYLAIDLSRMPTFRKSMKDLWGIGWSDR